MSNKQPDTYQIVDQATIICTTYTDPNNPHRYLLSLDRNSNQWSCQCKGFMYYGRCRHIDNRPQTPPHLTLVEPNIDHIPTREPNLPWIDAMAKRLTNGS